MRKSVLAALLGVTMLAGPVGGAALAQEAPAESAGGVSEAEAVRFLMQSSFGPTEESIEDVRRLGYARWLSEQMRLPARSTVERLGQMNDPLRPVMIDLFWESALEADDQLRGRVAYALANIVVVSLNTDEFYFNPEIFATYYDILNREALGNYRDLVRDVSLSPAMGLFLSHLGNRKADETLGIAPDENYAREIMQLFTIGLVNLKPNGQSLGTESYTTEDVEGLAEVFTGLSWANRDFRWAWYGEDNIRLPMQSYADYHEPGAKSFLGRGVPAGTDAAASVTRAVDHLIRHPNAAPFVSQQLIQHLVTSNPTPRYVRRVARAFERGRFESGGVRFGTGRRGDMQAVVAAILLDEEARSQRSRGRTIHGRLRDPILRFAHLTRAYRDDEGATFSGTPETSGAMRYADAPYVLGQKVFSAPSVFGWYRPGYVPPGGWLGARGGVAPEMELATAANQAGFIRWMAITADSMVWNTDFFDLDVASLEALAADEAALLDAVDLRLTAGTLQTSTRNRILAALATIPPASRDREGLPLNRVRLALLMVATAPEFAVQR